MPLLKYEFSYKKSDEREKRCIESAWIYADAEGYLTVATFAYLSYTMHIFCDRICWERGAGATAEGRSLALASDRNRNISPFQH